MKDTAPISQGIIALAALFAIIGAGVAFVLYDFSLFASVVIGCVVGAVAAIALLIGWRAPQKSDPQNVSAPTAKPAAVASAPKAQAPASAAPAPEAKAPEGAKKPQFLSAAREGRPDDLKLIKGVGPKLEKTLHDMGLFHFDQIAAWGPKEQSWMDDNLVGFKGRATRDDWVTQAKILADGGETKFSKKK